MILLEYTPLLARFIFAVRPQLLQVLDGISAHLGVGPTPPQGDTPWAEGAHGGPPKGPTEVLRRGPRPPGRPSVPRLLENWHPPLFLFGSSPLSSSSNLSYPLRVFRSQPDMTCCVLGPGAKAWSYWSHWTAILLGERRNHVDEIQHGNLNSDID